MSTCVSSALAYRKCQNIIFHKISPACIVFIIFTFSYTRVIKKIGQQRKTNLRWSLGALMALHTAAEDYITLFKLSNLTAICAH